MRIIYKSKHKMNEFFNEQKQIARKGCNICPGCGREFFNEDLEEITKNIVRPLKFNYNTFHKNFPYRVYQVFTYTCLICGSIWETEPFLMDCDINRNLFKNGKIFKYALKEDNK